MNVSTPVAIRAKSVTRSLKDVVNRNLAKQRIQATKHRKEVIEQERTAKKYKQELDVLMKRAEQGAKALLALHQSKEVQEALRLLEEVHGLMHKLYLYDVHVDYKVEYLNWQWTWSSACMTSRSVLLYVQQVGAGNGGEEGTEIETDLTSPGYHNGVDEVDLSIKQEISRLHSLHVGTPEWIVESVKTVHLHEEIDIPLGEFPPEWERMTWFAFLISCGDEAKLAKIMDEAFNKVITN